MPGGSRAACKEWHACQASTQGMHTPALHTQVMPSPPKAHLLVFEAPQQLVQHVRPLRRDRRAARLAKQPAQQLNGLEALRGVARAELVGQVRHHRQQRLRRHLVELRGTRGAVGLRPVQGSCAGASRVLS